MRMRVYTNKISRVINQWNWEWAERHVSPRPNVSPQCFTPPQYYKYVCVCVPVCVRACVLLPVMNKESGIWVQILLEL